MHEKQRFDDFNPQQQQQQQQQMQTPPGDLGFPPNMHI